MNPVGAPVRVLAEFTAPAADRAWLWERKDPIVAKNSVQFVRTLNRLQAHRRGFDESWAPLRAEYHSRTFEEKFGFLDEWYATWARQLRTGDLGCQDLTLDRRAVNAVLFSVWNLTKRQTPAEERRVDEAEAKWYYEVCCTTLPLDRAECLFKMHYAHSPDVYGMHWVCKYHGRDLEIYQQVKELGGECPMNKRYVEICQCLGLSGFSTVHVSEDSLFKRLLDPTFSPREPVNRHEIAIPEPEVENMVSPVEVLLEAIEQAAGIGHFVDIYNSQAFVQYLFVLRNIARGDKLLVFSEQWANNPSAYALGREQIEMFLKLFEKMHDCLTDVNNESVTHDSIRNVFKMHRFVNVLSQALPMAQAWVRRHQTVAWPPPKIEELCEGFADDLECLREWLEPCNHNVY